MAGINLFQAKTWFSVGVRRRPKGWLVWLITPFAAAIAVFVLSAATVVIIAPWALTAIFLSAMLALAFLTVGAFPNSDAERPTPTDWALSAISVATGVYFAIHAEGIVNRIALLDPLSGSDVLFGTALFLLTLEVTRRTTGLGLTAVVLMFIAYNFLGHMLGGVLGHGYIDYQHFLDIIVFTTDGILGLPVRVAATYVYLFVLFGTVLYYAGGSNFFFDFAAAISGRRPGGPAKVAVVSSGLYGMISGSPTSDVVVTGSITIPIMRRLGYPRALAGAVEVAASTGGSLVPPVMGSAAFIMAEYTGIEYRDIVIAAVLPALLYYVSIYAQVHFRSLKMGLRSLDEDRIPRLGPTLRQGGLFFVPLVALTAGLLFGYTPTMVAVFGTVAVLAVAALRKKTRLGPSGLFKALAETSFRMVPVAGACAAAGLVIAGITMTGLAAKFAHVVYAIAGAEIFPSLLIAAALTIVLGLGMPTPSAYILAAVLMGPLLANLGVPNMPAHLFLLYYAVMSAITPPVAVAAYAASSFAEANPLHIAALAVRLALAAFIVPFAFVYGPELLMIGSPWEILAAFITAGAGVVLLALAVEGYWKTVISWWARLLLAGAGVSLIAPWIYGILIGAALAAFAFAFGAAFGLRNRRGPA